MFSTLPKTKFYFTVTFILLSANAFNLDQSKNLSFGKELSHRIKPCPKRQILESSKVKQFADDNFEFDENGSKFAEQVENTVGKGEIAHYKQFLLSPQCFEKTCTTDT